jgi:hypothetical protein
MINRELKGIGGWLYLYAFCLILAALISLLLTIYNFFINNIQGVAIGMVLFLFFLWVNIIFFSKLKLTIRVLKGIFTFAIIVNLTSLFENIDIIKVSRIIVLPYITYVITSILFIGIYIASYEYFRKSSRVKNTFVD